MKRAFTVVELLIVVVIIAVLASIVVVAYRGVTDSAAEASMRSDLKNTADNLLLSYTNGKTLPNTLSDDEKIQSEGNQLVYSKTGAASFCLFATSINTDKKLKITEKDPISYGACMLTWQSIAVAHSSVCATASDSQLYCWGDNYYGQLGDGTTVNQASPVAVQRGEIPAGVTIDKVAAGTHHVCVATSNGQLYCWGRNDNGQLGNGTTGHRASPVAVLRGAIPVGVTIKTLAAGMNHTCVLASDNKAYCWGYNNYGQLGDDTTAPKMAPVAVAQGAIPAGVSLVQIAANYGITCAIATNGKAYCWGDNFSGQIGNGTSGSSNSRMSPTAVLQGAIPSGLAITAITPTQQHTCALASDNKAYCWGSNANGQLGDNTLTQRTTPVAVLSGTIGSKSVQSVLAGGNYTCALVNYWVHCWGRNTYSELGDGTTADRLTPQILQGGAVPSGVQVGQLASSGNAFGCLLTVDGRIYCWGNNTKGQLGDGTTSLRSVPVLSSAPTG